MCLSSVRYKQWAVIEGLPEQIISGFLRSQGVDVFEGINRNELLGRLKHYNSARDHLEHAPRSSGTSHSVPYSTTSFRAHFADGKWTYYFIWCVMCLLDKRLIPRCGVWNKVSTSSRGQNSENNNDNTDRGPSPESPSENTAPNVTQSVPETSATEASGIGEPPVRYSTATCDPPVGSGNQTLTKRRILVHIFIETWFLVCFLLAATG